MKYECSCKYITIDSILVIKTINLLYDVLEEYNGGLAHIVASDNNLDDESLKCVIDECNKEENKDRHDVHICKVLCESLLRLNILQRYFIFAFIESDNDVFTIDDLEYMVMYSCYLGHPCNCSDECPLKHNLNKFAAEKKCIEETGNNLMYLDGKYPIIDIKEE